MAVMIRQDCLRLDREWTDEEVDRFRNLIEERRSWGYYQRLTIEDARGRRLETPGSHLCLGTLKALDLYGFPHDFAGKTVLDIGCNAGFYSFVAKLRGASSVLGLDLQRHYIDQALLMRQILGIDVDFRQVDGHALDERLGSFDIVINTGVIYHLQNPMDFLTKIAAITRETMYLETEALTDPKLAEYAWFIEGKYAQDPSNWWVVRPDLCRAHGASGWVQDGGLSGIRLEAALRHEDSGGVRASGTRNVRLPEVELFATSGLRESVPGTVPQSPLCAGPGGVGTCSTAIALAQAVNCGAATDGDAYGRCDSARSPKRTWCEC